MIKDIIISILLKQIRGNVLYTRKYTVETATFNLPCVYQTDEDDNGRIKVVKRNWSDGKTRKTDVSIPKGTIGNKVFFQDG